MVDVTAMALQVDLGAQYLYIPRCFLASISTIIICAKMHYFFPELNNGVPDIVADDRRRKL